MTNTSNPRHCIAIAYRWLLAPAGMEHFDVSLILAIANEYFDPNTKQSVVLSGVAGGNEVRVLAYHAALPPKPTPVESGDVSGTLGLLWPTSDRKAELKAAAFERLVADTILWAIAGQKVHEDTIILIQGPLLPKLRGRLLYRGISERTPIYSITYQREWFNRIESAQATLDDRKIGLGQLYPRKSIDRATRSWVFYPPQQDPCHFELLCNMWDPCENADYLDQRGKEIEVLMAMAEHCSVHHDTLVQIPRPLAAATNAAVARRLMEEQFLWLLHNGTEPSREVNVSVNRPSSRESVVMIPDRVRLSPSPLSKVFGILAPTEPKQGMFEAATTTNIAIEELYKRFLNDYAKIADAITRATQA